MQRQGQGHSAIPMGASSRKLKQVHKYAPDFPVLTEEQRRASPAQRVPMVLEHPLNHEPALYGMNGGTCRVLSREASPRV